MSNMSYCRFENTASDINDCIAAIEEAGGDKEVLLAEAHKREKEGYAAFISTIVEFIQEYPGLVEDEGHSLEDLI